MTQDIEKRLYNTAAGKQWQAIGAKHHHGVCLPLFSLRSEKSCGIGEYLDLIPFFAFCKAAKFDVVQLLPLNDTGYDTSPYSAISAFALRPLHLSLEALPGIDKAKLAPLKALNSTPRIDYPKIHALKKTLLEEYYAQFFNDYVKRDDYQLFCKSHLWLQSYALFKTLKAKNGWRAWEQWPPVNYEQALIDYQKEMQLHYFWQFLCFEQMHAAKKEAEKMGILLKGDIPILINRDSADVWANRHLFNLESTVGAPPDAYTTEGQNWGFPLYNWKEHEKDNYAWWRSRLATASELYHLYRIDHVVGFFRLWAIPNGKKAKEGMFIPAEKATSLANGKNIMKMMLQTSPLLPIGEDLGMVPTEVKHCLKDLGICGTKVMRWERNWEEDKSFIPPADYFPESMTTVSTHDSEPLALWWKQRPDEAKPYADFKGWTYQPLLTTDQRTSILYDSHHSGSLFHINLLQEYLALFPELISTNIEEERINLPGTHSDFNWTYRFKPSIEQMLSHPLLIPKIKEILKTKY